MSKRSHALNVGRSLRQSSKNSSDVSTLLHGDDSQLILLIDPDEEGLLVVVEDASSFGPVSVEATSIQEAVTFFEEEVVSDQLLLLLCSHGAKRVESAGKFSLK